MPRCTAGSGSTASTPGAPTATAATSAADAGSYVSRQMVGWADLDEYGTWDTHPDLRCGLVPDVGRRRLGAVSLRPLDVRRQLGLDLGRRRALGLCAVRTTVAGRGSAVAGAGAPAPTSRVRSGRRRWSAGTAAPGGRCPSTPAHRSTAGCRSAGATPMCRGGAAAAAASAAGRTTTVRTRCPTWRTAPSVRTRRRPSTRTARCPARSPRSPARRWPAAGRSRPTSSRCRQARRTRR